MKKITTATDLKIAIQELEYQKAAEWPQLKEQFLVTYESLKPLNILKSKLNEVVPIIKDNMAGIVVSLIAGNFSKESPDKTLFGSIKKASLMLLELAIVKLVDKNQEKIESLVENIINAFKNNKESNV